MSEPNKFEITKKLENDVSIVYIGGYLDAHTAPELENTKNNVIISGINKIIVNFSSLDYISSAGLGVFMAFIEDIRGSGGDIKMTSMKPKVFSVFDLLGFPVLFDIEVDEDKAMEKFLNGIVKGND